MSGDGPGQREVAHRLFAAEFDDATFTFTESDEERAPNYVVTPTGSRVNRLFLVGVLTEAEWVNDETIRARVVDPTGAFVLYASQYQPDARGVLDAADSPTFIAVTGKANTFRPDGTDRIYTSVRPEAVAVVDAATRDRWAVSTAEHSIVRLGRLAAALTGDEEPDRGVEIARREYDLSPAYVSAMYELCIDVLRLIADEVEALPDRNPEPDMAGEPTTALTEIADAAARLGDHEPERTTEAEMDVHPPERAGDGQAAEESAEAVISDDEREEIEKSFGTDFTTGDEIESQESDANGASKAEVPKEGIEATATGPEADPVDPTDEREAAEARADELSVDALVDLMRNLGDGGVSKEVLIDAGSDTFGADEEAVEDTLQSALLEGRCYESGDDEIRPI